MAKFLRIRGVLLVIAWISIASFCFNRFLGGSNTDTTLIKDSGKLRGEFHNDPGKTEFRIDQADVQKKDFLNKGDFNKAQDVQLKLQSARQQNETKVSQNQGFTKGDQDHGASRIKVGAQLSDLKPRINQSEHGKIHSVDSQTPKSRTTPDLDTSALQNGIGNTSKVGPEEAEEKEQEDEKTVPLSFLPPDEDSLNISSRQYVIYRCEPSDECGGWADRVKGMIVGFIMASLTGRVFKVELPMTDCLLEDFLVPNLYNWSLPRTFHKDIVSKNLPDVRNFNFMTDVNFYQNIHKYNFRKQFGSAKYVYMKANLDYVDGLKNSLIYQNQLSWTRNLTRDVISAKLFRTLFNVSTTLENSLTQFLNNVTSENKSLICAHFRMGRNPSFPDDTVVRQSLGDLPVVWDFIRNQTNRTSGNYSVFFMSDSDEVVQKASQQDFKDHLVMSPGPIVHMDREKKKAHPERCLGFQKVLFDQQVLTRCDVLMVSMSGLSRMAAYVRQRDEGLFCLLRTKPQDKLRPPRSYVEKCQMRRVKELYGVMG